jgi:hypothetical protein
VSEPGADSAGARMNPGTVDFGARE